jgi:hypothetical protein
MYAMQKWETAPKGMKLIEHNLLSGQGAEFSVTEREIAETKAYIKGSIADMESLLIDVKDNVLKEERFFKKIENTKLRDRCNFRKVCEATSD